VHTRKSRNTDEAGFLAAEVLTDSQLQESAMATLPAWDISRSPLPPAEWLEQFDNGVREGGAVDISPILTLIHTEITGRGRRGLKLSRDHIFMYKNKRKMDDELPWVIFDPDVVVALSGKISPVSLSVMIAGCVLTQLSRRGTPGSWESSFVIRVEDEDNALEWLQRLYELFNTWNSQTLKYTELKLQEMRVRTGEACIPPQLFRRMMELTTLPRQAAKDLRSMCRNFSFLISSGAKLYYENTLVLEHVFGMVRMIAGGQQMPPAAAIAALGKMKRQSLAFAVDNGQLEAAAKTGLADRSPRQGRNNCRRTRRGLNTPHDSDLDREFVCWRNDFLEHCNRSSTMPWLRDSILAVGTQARRFSESNTDNSHVQIARILLLDTRGGRTGDDTSVIDDLMLPLLWLLHGGPTDLVDRSTPDSWRPEIVAGHARSSLWLYRKWKSAVVALLPDVSDDSIRMFLGDVIVTLSRETTLDLARTIRAVKTPLRINADNNPSLTEALNSDTAANSVIEVLNKIPNVDHTVDCQGSAAPSSRSSRAVIVNYIRTALEGTPESQ